MSRDRRENPRITIKVTSVCDAGAVCHGRTVLQDGAHAHVASYPSMKRPRTILLKEFNPLPTRGYEPLERARA